MADKKTSSTSEELKNEAVKTANDAKKSVEKADFKKEAKNTSNFVLDLFKDPLSTIEGVITDKKNSKFITAIIIFGIWLVFILINSFRGLGSLGWGNFWIQVGEIFSGLIRRLLAPIIGVGALTLILFLFPKKGTEKRSLTSILTLSIVTAIPAVVIEVLTFLLYFKFLHFYKPLEPLTLLSYLLSGVLAFYSIKAITKETDEKKLIRSFVIIQGIYFVLYFVFSFMKITLPII